MKVKSEGGLQERALALCRANPAVRSLSLLQPQCKACGSQAALHLLMSYCRLVDAIPCCFTQGVTQEQMQSNLSLTEKECLELVNFLLATQRVEPLTKDGSMLFKERNPELAMK